MIEYPPLPPLEFRFRLIQKGFVADLEILGVVTGKTLIDLVRTKRITLLETTDEFLVPAGNQRRAVADTAGGRIGLRLDRVVGHDAGHQAFLLRLGGAEDATLEKDL